jgi:hypothetical protein
MSLVHASSPGSTSDSWQRERCRPGYSRFSTEYGPIAFDLIRQKDSKTAKAAKTTEVKRSELDQQLLQPVRFLSLWPLFPCCGITLIFETLVSLNP